MGLFALSRSRSVRDVLWRLRHLVPALALFGVWLFALDGLSADAARVGSNRHEALHGALWEPAGDTFAAAHTRLLSVFPDEMDERITTALFLVLGLVVALRGLGSQATQWRDLAPEALTLFVVAFYLLMPIRYDWIWPLNARFLPLAALLALLWGTATLPRWGERSLTALCGLIAAAAMLFQSVSFDQVDTEARDFDEVLEALRPGSRVRSIIFDRDSAQIEMPVYLHLVQYHAVRNGGLVVPSFAEAPQSPIRFRPPSEGGPPPTPLFADTRPSEFRFDKDARYFDYFVVRGEPADFASNVGFDSSVAFLMRSGTWTVYEHRRAD